MSGKDAVFVALPTATGQVYAPRTRSYLFHALRGHPTSTSIIVVVTPLTSIDHEVIKYLLAVDRKTRHRPIQYHRLWKKIANNPRNVINCTLFLLTHAGSAFLWDTGSIRI